MASPPTDILLLAPFTRQEQARLWFLRILIRLGKLRP